MMFGRHSMGGWPISVFGSAFEKLPIADCAFVIPAKAGIHDCKPPIADCGLLIADCGFVIPAKAGIHPDS